MNRSTRYLIIGNSAAGVAAAESIRKADPQAPVLMLSREPYAAYGRPLISYMVEGKTTKDKVYLKPESFYRDNNLETLFGPEYEAVSLQPEQHTATLANGDTVAYEKCLMATGSNPFTPPFEGICGTEENVHNFITLDDALAAWKSVTEATAAAHAQGRKSRVVVIGGGLIGLKAAEALSHHADEICVFERSPRILPVVLDNTGAGILQGLLEPYGITCRPGFTADRFEVEDGRVVRAHITDDTMLDVDVLMLCVGVRPNSKLAVDAGAQQGRGLICGPDLQTSLPDVYAAGDLVQVTDSLDGAQRPLALWPNALQQGALAGAHMAGAAEAEDFLGSFAVNAVDFFEHSLLTAGVINPAPEGGFQEHIFTEGSRYVKFVTKDDRLYGYILLNRPQRAGVYTSIIRSGIPLSSFAGDVFQNPPQNIDFPQDMRMERIHKGYPRSLDYRGWKEQA